MKDQQTNIDDLMMAKELLHKVEGGLRYYDPIVGPGLPSPCNNFGICVVQMYGTVIDRHFLDSINGDNQ